MKKALAFISALTFASAAQSDGFLADNELRLRPISYNPNEDSSLEDFPQVFPRNFPRDLPRLVYVDDAEDNEQYAPFNIVQNWHYPLKSLPMNNPLKPTPVQNQPQTGENSAAADNSLFNLGQLIQNFVENIQRTGEVIQKEGEVIHRRQEVRRDRAPPGKSSSIKDDLDDVSLLWNTVKNFQHQHR